FDRLPLDKYQVFVKALGDKDSYSKPRNATKTVSLFKWNPRDRQVTPAFPAKIILGKGTKKPKFIVKTKIKNKGEMSVLSPPPEPSQDAPKPTDTGISTGMSANDASSPDETVADSPVRAGTTGEKERPTPRTREECIRLMCPNCKSLLFFGTLDEPCMSCIESTEHRLSRCMEGYNDY
ncbi:MAG: hypothetical protein KKE61_07120, partial [Proteobacteria bacterium]|nr:hypothetical protein [Pseudomonadota bacterium]